MPKLLSEIINQNRAERTLGKLLDRDQGIKRNPDGSIRSQSMPPARSRERMQGRLARVFDNPQNREALIRPSKLGIQGRHDAWVLAQHMDAKPKTQQLVYDTMKKYDPSNPRTNFLKDRIGISNASRAEYNQNPERYSSYGKDAEEAIKNMRIDREEFKTAKTAPKSAQDALGLEKKYKNELLVKGVEKYDASRPDRLTRGITGPSFATKWDDLPSPKPKSTVDTIKSTASEYASKALSNPVVKTGLRVLSNPVVGGIMTAMEPTPANAGEDELLRQKKYQSKTP